MVLDAIQKHGTAVVLDSYRLWVGKTSRWLVHGNSEHSKGAD